MHGLNSESALNLLCLIDLLSYQLLNRTFKPLFFLISRFCGCQKKKINNWPRSARCLQISIRGRDKQPCDSKRPRVCRYSFQPNSARGDFPD